MRIADFVEQEVDCIVHEWVAFARTRVPSSQQLSTEELEDHAKVLLLSLSADIRDRQSERERHDKSQGNAQGNAPEITRIARDHAAQRFQQGFSLDDLLSEFRALRASVIRRWTQQIPDVNHDTLDQLIRFGEALDQALSESAALYSQKVDDSRNLLLGVLGHDLRTPLGVVHLSASYLLRTDTLDGAQTKAAARILTSAERMTLMVKDILDFTQTAFGVPLPISPAPADLGQLTKNIVGEVTTLYPQSEVDISCEGPLTGHWDSGRIAQMLSNLIANAVQHGEASRPVSVRVAGDGDAVSVQVQNAGRPISAEAQKNLFFPLRQEAAAHGEQRAGSSGLGLGLYIAREIATAHGGTLEVSSGEEGTSFVARLPRAAPTQKDRRVRSMSRTTNSAPGGDGGA